MQEHYTAELEAERQRTEDLARQNEEMMRKMGEMERRLQMHVVLMDGFVGFMRDVKEGKFATGGGAELEIAKSFGGEHLDEVRGLVAESYMPVQQSVEQPATEHMVFGDQDEPHETTAIVRHMSFDESPPTPDLEAPPVRSTGRRAPKRKNPPLRPHREVKRQTRANLRSVRLRNTSSWTAINTRNSPYAGADMSNGEDKDLDFTPDLEVDDDDEEEEEEEEQEVVEEEEDNNSDDEMEDIPNAPATPSPSLSDEDLETTKTRYSAPRSVAYRYASGPPGRKFKYHRMPKSVALVWQEWKHGSNGNPSIQSLEEKYSTRWRMGTLQERKYASNYVGVRQKVVRKVEEMCEQKGLTPEKACEILDRRVDGRMQLLMTALRKGQDPLVVIPRRYFTARYSLSLHYVTHCDYKIRFNTMCYIQVVHITCCETRRPAIINTTTGKTVYHPLEPPGICEHHRPFGGATCHYHGDCCSPGQIFFCNAKGPRDICRGRQAYHINIHPHYMYESGVLHQMEPIEDWEALEMNTDVFAYEEDIRYQFFEAGALMYELEQDAEKLVEYILRNRTSCPEEEAELFLEHGDLYEMWSEAHHHFVGLTEAWEILANVGCMEVCPSSILRVHPWRDCFQEYPTLQTGFPQFSYLPFAWVENVERQDDILRWHPYYSQYQIPPRPKPSIKDDALWTSPAPYGVNTGFPERTFPRAPEVQQQIGALPYPGEWTEVFEDRARRMAQIESEPTSLSSSSGPEIPPWVIPYGQEPDMGWKDIDWHNCTTVIEPPMSPKSLPREGVVQRVMPPKDSYMNPGDVPTSPAVVPDREKAKRVSTPWRTQPASREVIPGNLFGDPLEAPWNGYSFTGTEKSAEQEFLHVPLPVEESQGITPQVKKSLKRKSEEDLDGVKRLGVKELGVKEF
ncbi:hypothetical protein F25303_9826 [Fusarium sp. NRRL 25303]|nr:hypothetical protein F25303_9826 [Fusarium sp. NRRL 25303]